MYHLCYINTMVLTSTLILAQRVETTGIMFNSIICIYIFVLGTQVSHMLEILFRMGLKQNWLVLWYSNRMNDIKCKERVLNQTIPNC
jgi:hypothetical protein